MKLIVGLGNPGSEYVNTRHNAGFLVVDELKNRISNFQFPIFNQFKIFKSDKFMNDSGSFVLSLYTKYNIQNTDLYIIHDDLDIKLGEYKIQFGRGPKDHNGILDIEDKLGTKDFWRVRIGIYNRPLDNKPMGEVYTLEDFTEEERVTLDRVIKEVASKLDNI